MYFVDGVQVASHTATITGDMHPMAAEYQAGGYSISVDWLRLSPYQTPGVFQSRVFDAVGAATWGAPSWTADVPASTTMNVSVRTGDTPAPDASWTGFTPVSYGWPIDRASRYLQYQVDINTGDTLVTPILYDISIGYTLVPDNTPPGISSRIPAPGAASVQLDANVLVTFDEAMDPGTINASNIRLRALGAVEDVPAAVSYADRIATLNPDANLLLGKTYRVTVSGGVQDLSGNSLGGDTIWSFTTVAIGSFMDTTEADFGAGTPDAGSYIARTVDGEVMLAPVVGNEFSGITLPGDWLDVQYGPPGQNDGTATLSNGWLVLNGKRVGPNALFTPGRWLEFYGTFTNGLYTHAGFGVDFANPPWAIFSTFVNGAEFHARSATSIPGTNSPLGIAWNGVPHLYRIEWNAGTVNYFVDGVQVTNHAVAIGASMRPMAAEYDFDALTLSLDWLRMGPYQTSGVFLSRVFDAGAPAVWDNVVWNSQTPPGSSLVMSVRTGDTPAPDTGWSDFITIAASGDQINRVSRYIQYQVELATSDASQSAVLNDVTVNYALQTNQAPTANDDDYSTNEDTPLMVEAPGVLSNDADPENDPLFATKMSGPANGAASLAANGSFTYTPNSCFNGYDAFTYKANDGTADSNEAIVSITVNPVNHAPVADAGGPYTADLGGSMTLDGSGSSDPDVGCPDEFVTYEWLVGDSIELIELFGPDPTLTADEIDVLGLGEHPVQLTVTDAFGATDTAATTLTVYDNRPFASFTAIPNPAACSQVITFDAIGSYHGRPDRSIVGYSWDFGDGQTGTGMNVTHAYSHFGSYTASLTVTDDNVPAKTDSAMMVIRCDHGQSPSGCQRRWTLHD